MLYYYYTLGQKTRQHLHFCSLYKSFGMTFNSFQFSIMLYEFLQHCDELIGQQHYILRHPDMPKAAYKDLWDTAESGQKWHGYVKNLCKDGSHYWVYATVVPNVRRGETVGYTSVRRKPSRSKIEAAMAQYAQMKQDEEG